jgi:Protein of unknown function (DUF732)
MFFRAVLIAAAILAAVAFAVPAHADTADDQFMAALARDGIARDGINVPAAQAIPIAHETCDAQGMSRIGIGIPAPYSLAHMKIGSELNAFGLTHPQMLTFEHDAIIAYCPQ